MRTTVALVANERRGRAGAQCASASTYGADVRRFGVDDSSAPAASGADRLVVAGGDGSIGPGRTRPAGRGIPLAVVPPGPPTTSRAARAARGSPTACRLAVRGTKLQVAGARVDERRAPVRERGERRSAGPGGGAGRGWKDRLGPLAYAAGALAAGLSAKPITCLVVCNGRELLAGEAWQVTVRARRAPSARRASIEEADPTDGALEVVAIEAGSRPAS